MSEDGDFSKVTRRLLFREASQKGKVEEKIPGAGKSAAATPSRHVRIKVTMNVDGDIVQYFKKRGKEDGRPYQSLMNQVLREYIDGSRPEKLAREVREALIEDEEFLLAVSEKLQHKSKAD